MNNIYKVIWSKAKNCYVVASEIARSHTKSASGSEKIRGGTRRKLLASLMALSLLCGGLGVASAADSTVHVDASTTPSNATEVYTTTGVNTLLADYGKKTDVETNKNNITALQTTTMDHGKQITANATDIANIKTAIDEKIDTTAADAKYATNEALNNLTTTVTGKADRTYVDQKFTEAGTNVDNKLGGYYDKATVDGKIAAEATARDTAINTAIGLEREDRNAAIGNAINGEVAARNQEIQNAIGREETNRDAAISTAKAELQGKITAEETERKEADTAFNNRLTTAEGKIGDNTTAIDALKAKDTVLEGQINTLDGRGVKYDDAAVKDTITLKGPDGTKITRLKDATLSDSSTDAVTGKQLNQTNENLAAETAARENKDNELARNIQTNADKIQTNSNAIADTNKRTAGIDRIDATKETTIEGNVSVDSLGNVTAEGKLTGKGVDAGDGTITTKGAVNAGLLTVENASNLKGDVTMNQKLNVTGDTSLGKTDVGGALNVTGESSLKNTKVEGMLTTTGKATFQEAVEMDKGLTVTSGDTTLKGKLTVTGEADLKNTEVGGTLGVTGATTLSGELTAKENATFEKDAKVGKNLTVDGTTNLKDTTVTGNLNVTGTITTDKMVFGDKATNNYTEIDKGHITSQNDALAGDATKKSSSMELDHSKLEVGVADKDSNGHLTMTADKTSIKNSDLAGKNYSEIVADKDSVKTTVKDEEDNTTSTKSSATEIRNYAKDAAGNKTNNVQTATQNKSWAKDKDGNESSIVQTGKDITNTAQNGTITNDAQNIVNNATGDMTNTVGGKLTTTVTGQATENFNGGLDTNVTGTENHIVTGNQNIHVTENQTNKIDGNQENTIGGEQTTTVEGKVTENYKAGQETNVTGDKKTTVTGKTTEEYKGGLETTVTGDEKHTVTGNQTTTVTGNISNTAKNITNEANETLTDKVGTNTRVTTLTSITDTVGTTTNRKIEDGKITDTAGDSTVVTENEKGTTFTKTGSAAYSTEAGAPTDTNIAGNRITTGRVDANELKVSDKDDHGNTADLSVEAGEGVKASASNGTTTGSLDVKADEVGSTVKDADGKGSTFKQRIDKIMMESKEVSIKAEETLTNEAKVITNKASEVINNEAVNINNTATGIINSKASEIKNQADKLISNKVGENTSEYMEDGKITTSVKDGAKSTVTIQNADGLQTGVTNGTSTNASATTATSSAQTIASGNKANSVITTIDGTQFVNSDAWAPVTGESGAGTADRTTIKGNTITTGKVTMDYADVMKDLGVRGNANITGKTTTGSLEVKGESKLTGDVTMESNATVGNNLTVNGTTKTKTLNVTENAEVGGTLKVAKKATFEDSVSIAKDLTVGGDVTAKSYKVGDKTYISADGINANDQKITNVADGSISEGSKDAVNGGQLYGMKTDLEHKVDKVGANAAAMANLHPMEFDPDSKWNIAAAMGNYGSETATAIGAFYRPNEDVMVNFSTAFGTGENMVGGGVSVRLGKGGNKLSREETNALKAQVNDLTARMDALLSVLNPNMSKDFPDVPENHWAYEAVSRLAGNDIVQGYPDGEFHGERTMTRYEMAEIIYNALSRGAEAERELVEEFKPELQAMAASEKATAERAEG